ncbi:MAG TPA: hypothetical protein VGD67_13390 [Pseudonocardiaceae bacterium]
MKDRLGWLLPVVVVLVLALGVGAGIGVRILAAQAGSDPAGGAVPTTTAAVPPPGPTGVTLSADAAAHPDGARIQELLQRHFNAINNHDYAVWVSTVVARRIADTSEEDWQQQYSTSRDGSIVVNRIEPATGGQVVLISFTSTQAPEDAPVNLPGADCVRWWVSYRVVTERGQPRIDAGVRNTTINAPC